MAPDTVILRRDPDGSLVALMPEYPADESGYLVTCYEHIGQHGAANYQHVIASTRPVRDVTAPDVVEFLAELQTIGYDVSLRLRRTEAMRKAARRNLYR